MRGGAKPTIRRVKEGRTIIEQGADDTDLFLVLNGVVTVEVDGEPVAELGPGAVLGERAVLEGGRRTSTVRAVTDCKLAVAGRPDRRGAPRRAQRRPSARSRRSQLARFGERFEPIPPTRSW